MGTQADLLENLLGKSAGARNPVPRSPDHSDRIVLYGAGNLGRVVLSRLRASGVEPLAFADDTAAKQGCILDGLQVLKPEEVINRFGSNVIFAVTILNPALRFIEARERLHHRTGGDVLSLLDLARMFPNALLPYLQYDRPEKIVEHAERIRRAFQTFSGEKSREQFIAHLEFRLTAKYDVLPAKSQPAYFPRDLIGRFSSDATFVDCGAYDGDSIRGFLAHQNRQFGAIFAFEPDNRNYEQLAAYVRSLGAEISSRIQLRRGAVGAHSGRVAFHETGDMSAAVVPDAAGKVDLFALDDAIPQSGTQTYIKFDIEGFELEALRGAARFLASERPTLAVSVYHRPADLWEIPLYLHDLDLGYRLDLRTEGEDGMDIVCYALPPDSTNSVTTA